MNNQIAIIETPQEALKRLIEENRALINQCWEIDGGKWVTDQMAPKSQMVQQVEASFDDFYAIYPKKVGKAAARKAFKRLKPSQALLERIREDIERRIAIGQWVVTDHRKQYIPGPAPYINGEKWDDEYLPGENAPRDFSAIARNSQDIG